LPIDIRLTAVAASGPQPLAQYLTAAQAGDREIPDLIVVPVQGAEAAGMDTFLGGPAARVIARSEASGDAGEIAVAVTGAGALGPGGRLGRFLFLGLGDGSPAAMRKAGAALGRRLSGGRTLLTSAVFGRPERAVTAFAEGLLLASYRFSLAGDAATGGGPAGGEACLLVAEQSGHADVVSAAGTIAGAVALARDLTNMPSGRKTPAWLAAQAVALTAGSGVTARVAEPAELAAHGFGGLLAVGSGSAQPPRLIELSYRPAQPRGHVVLVGKGITFDSGGLSLKPADGMKLMKTDMAGGAVVIAVMSALARLRVRARVTGLVAAAENMPSGSALRPGDVVSHYGGRTVEVLNTDAEGRLVLADALAYADAVLQPDAMVDIATLTGAVRVALGTRTSAMYASDDQVAQALLAAAEASGEALWRMPLVEDYRDALDSPVADLANVSRGIRGRAGSIDAALFLREFTGGRPWAHLDIAGAARSASDDGENTKGATGYGTRLLLAWLSAPEPLAALDGRQDAIPDRQQ
jgi:leucyl aminopeptidase